MAACLESEVDAENLTVGRFPIVVAITAIIVFSTIGVRYGAVLIPVKLIFTIAVLLGFLAASA